MSANSLEGIIKCKHPYDWHPVVGGERATNWFEKRIRELPDGAYIKITVEVLDPHPEKK